MSTATVFFSYLVARELFPRGLEIGDRRLSTKSPISNLQSQTLLRLATPIFVACTPMFALISGAINNDNAAVMFSAIGVWWALRLMRSGDLSIKSAIVAGAIAGLGALSKSSALGLAGLFGFAALLTGFDARRPRSFIFHLSSFIIAMFAVTLVISGWWFIRNQQLYGDLLGWNAFLDVVGRRDTPASLAQLWTEREGFVWAYWGVFGTLNVIMTPWIYDALNALFVIAMVGAAYGIGTRFLDSRRQTSIIYRQLLLCAFWVALVFVAFVRWTSLTPASQGRLLFPCISVIAAAMAYGLWRIHRYLLIAACAGMAILAIATPFAFIMPAYAQPANRWQARLPIPINATFGNAIQLIEGSIEARRGASLQPGDEVTLRLNWQLTQPMTRNYSAFVHLIDENDVIVAQRDMYPARAAWR
jgi:hypothetical protein